MAVASDPTLCINKFDKRFGRVTSGFSDIYIYTLGAGGSPKVL